MSTKTFLSMISFSKLASWSVSYLTKRDFSYDEKYSLCKIGSFLKKKRNNITIQDRVNYKRVTIKINNGGVILRDIEKGENIGTKKQYLVNKGDFIFSKIDARNGAFGIIPSELDGAIVTNDFPIFLVNNDIIETKYLVLITTTKKFIQFAQSCSSGTTNRQRINIDSFLDQEIPLPPLEEQNKIVEAYNQKIKQAEQAEQAANKLEEEIENYIYSELGIQKQEKQEKKKGLQFVRFKDLNRWDIMDTNIFISQKNKYPILPLKEFTIGKPLYGANEKGVKLKSDTRYIRITDINDSGTLNNEFVSPEKIDEKFLLKENDFLIARSGNTVGKTFLYKKEYGKAIYAGYLVKYIFNKNIVFPEYIAFYTQTSIFKNWVTKNQRISAQPNINGQEYLAAPFIIPPLSKQNEIVEHITALKEQIKVLRNQAEQNRQQAIIDFENTIFS